MSRLTGILVVIFLGVAAIGIMHLQGCDAKTWGGVMTINLPHGQKFVQGNWSGWSYWYGTRQMREGEEAESYTFKEKNIFGIFQGTVVINEYPPSSKETKRGP